MPITIKVRTGIAADKPVMHHLARDLQDWGISALTVSRRRERGGETGFVNATLVVAPPLVQIHGRSREQRYTKYADWDYIDRVANTVPDLPVFGTRRRRVHRMDIAGRC